MEALNFPAHLCRINLTEGFVAYNDGLAQDYSISSA